MADYAGRCCVRCPVQSASGEPNSACAGIARALFSVPGAPMQRNRVSNNPLWRSLVGCVVAYALIINALLSGVVGAEWAAQAAAGLLGERCPTDALAAAREAPAGQADDSSRCAFCTLVAPPVVLPADQLSATIIPPRAGAPSGASDRDLILWPGHPSQLPRGPPQRS